MSDISSDRVDDTDGSDAALRPGMVPFPVILGTCAAANPDARSLIRYERLHYSNCDVSDHTDPLGGGRSA